MLAVYIAWVSPFEVGFFKKLPTPLFITDIAVNALLAINIFLTFFVAYNDKATNMLIDNKKKIAKRYARNGVVFLEIICTFPALVLNIFPALLKPTFGYIFNMLRVWHLRRVSSLFSR